MTNMLPRKQRVCAVQLFALFFVLTFTLGIFEDVTGSFVSFIHVPSQIKSGEKITSQPTSIGGNKWQLVLFPRGNKTAKKMGFASVYLNLIEDNDVVSEDVCFEISILPRDLQKAVLKKPRRRWRLPKLFGREEERGDFSIQEDISVETKSTCREHTFLSSSASSNPWGFMKFIKQDDLFQTSRGYRDAQGRVALLCRLGSPNQSLPPVTGLRLRKMLLMAGASAGGGGDMVAEKERHFGGLVNQGNTCYLNSLLQLLYHLPAFRDLLIPGSSRTCVAPGPVGEALGKVFAALKERELQGQEAGGAVSTTPLTSLLGVDPRVQQDAQEFNRLLVAAMEDTDQGGQCSKGVQSLFRGTLLNYLRCPEVGFEKTWEEPFYDISLDIDSCESIEDSLNQYVKAEELTGDNGYKPPGHEERQDAVKGAVFQADALPPVLQFHLKRFQYNMYSGGMSKINKPFKFPIEINMAPYTADSGATKSCRYVLHGVVIHVGGAFSGHYYSYINPGCKGDWYVFDDQRVQRISEVDVLSDAHGTASSKITAGFNPSKYGGSGYLLQYVKQTELQNVFQQVYDE